MKEGLLLEFFQRSRKWARATRGLELFQMAAADLKNIAGVDSGFIVYRKRFQSDETSSPERTNVYAPWGVFAKKVGPVQSLLDHIVLTRNMLTSVEQMMEQWISLEDMPLDVRFAIAGFGVLEMGIWPLVSEEQVIGAIVAARTEALSNSFSPKAASELLHACAAQVALALDLILARRMVEEASEHDPLTGLLNRRGLSARLPRLVEQAKSAGNCVVFGLADFDSLKAVNDSKGHPAGDEVLRRVAKIISRNVRANDLVARLGGDEFAIVLQADKSDAGWVMNRIQEAVNLDSEGCSVSVGEAVWGIDGNSFEECYRSADARLYDCKRVTKGIAR